MAATTIADAAETEPVIVRVPKPFVASRMRTVTPFPVRTTVAEVPTNAEPAPDVSQFPDTVHEPEAVTVPEVPPVIATLATPTADVPPVPGARELLEEELLQEPLTVHGPLPIARNGVGDEMVTLPDTDPFDAPLIWMLAVPERVSEPLTASPFPFDAPIVIVPPA